MIGVVWRDRLSAMTAVASVAIPRTRKASVKVSIAMIDQTSKGSSTKKAIVWLPSSDWKKRFKEIAFIRVAPLRKRW